MKQYSSYFQILLLLTFITSSIKADWINFTGAETAPNIAEIYISDSNITIKLEISFKDIKPFRELVPVAWTEAKGIKRPSLEDRLDYFSKHTLKIVADGKTLPVKLLVAEGRERIKRASKNAGKRNPYTNKIIEKVVQDKEVLYVELLYPLKKRAKNLLFVPPLDKDANVKATIGFIAYHKGVPLTDFRYLSKASALTLDLDDPWYSHFKNKNFTRHHKYPLMVYLYVEPRRVRLESLMRIDDIRKMTSFNQKNSNLSLLQAHVKNYFLQDKRLKIDNKAFAPDTVDLSFFKVGLSGLELLDNVQEKDLSSLLVGVSQGYYVDRVPNNIHSEWNYFNSKMENIPFVATDPKGPYPGFIYKDNPGFEWVNYIQDKSEPQITSVEVKTGKWLNLPLLGDTKVWGKLPNQKEATSIIDKIFSNLQVAFIEKEESHLDTQLKRVVHSQDKLLKNELAKLFTPSIVRGGRGEVSAFSEFDVKNIRKLKNRDGFSALISGGALITAYHWGHNDNLVLTFKTLVDFVEEEGKWYLQDFTLLELKDE